MYVDETNDHPFEYNFQTLFFTLSSAHGGDSIHTHEREGERINDARVYIGNTSEEEEQEERVSRNVQERERSREYRLNDSRTKLASQRRGSDNFYREEAKEKSKS